MLAVEQTTKLSQHININIYIHINIYIYLDFLYSTLSSEIELSKICLHIYSLYGSVYACTLGPAECFKYANSQTKASELSESVA